MLPHLRSLILIRKNVFLFSLVLGLSLISACFEILTFKFVFLAFSCFAEQGALPHTDWVIQFFISHGWTLSFSTLMLCIILCQILRSIGLLVAALVFSFLSAEIQETVQKTMLDKMFSLSFPFISKLKIGSLSDLFSLTTNSLCAALSLLNNMVNSLCFIVFLFFFMFFLSPFLSIAMLIFLGGTALIYRKLAKKVQTFSSIYSQQSGQFSEQVVEQLNGLRLIHYIHSHKETVYRLIQRCIDFLLSFKKVNFLKSTLIYSFEVIAFMQVGFLIWATFHFYTTMDAIIPTLIAFFSASHRLVARIQVFVHSSADFIANWGHLQRIDAFLESEDKEFILDGTEPLLHSIGTIEFKQVSFSYQPSSPFILSNINLCIESGKTVAIIGQSGAGKSSLLDLLMRLYEPVEGEIVSNGKKIHHFFLKDWRSKFGIVSQDSFLFHDSIENNLRFVKKSATQEEMIQAARLSGADLFISKLPQGYQTIIGDRGYRLSGGERQRLAIARALLRDPEILVLDEATNSLDSETEYVVQECIRLLKGKKTIIVVAHRLSTVVHADLIYVLEEGKILEQGTHGELIDTDSKYKKFWDLQTVVSS